jgi:lysophospholipase L1-like esterase
VAARTATALLCAGVSALCALSAEVGLRAAIDEVDFLQPQRRPHPQLRWTVEPGSAGHDRWGFRNRAVPDRADIVAIGDSQTYGVSAPASEAWPAWLAEMSGRAVYNLALGGYGPPDYLYLFERYVDRLAPRAVVVGVYLGNDLPRAFEGLKGFTALPPSRDTRRLGTLRTWLAQHSALYQVAKLEMSWVSDRLRFREASTDANAVVLHHPISATVFAPEVRLDALDQSQEQNRVGLERTQATLLELERACEARDITLVTLVLPTKESVYAALANAGLEGSAAERVTAVVREETRVRDALLEFLDANGVVAVDPLPDLRRAVAETRIYLGNRDGHPNGRGYRVIANAVQRELLAAGNRIAWVPESPLAHP